jgi:hypothetical protein
MLKKIALCAMLVLIIVPASVMAAGQGGQAGSGMQAQQKMSGDTMAQVQNQGINGQGSVTASQNGDTQMLRTRSCDQDCDMVRNMTKSQVRLGSASAVSGESPGAGYSAGNGSAYNTALQQQGGVSDAVTSRLSLQHRTQSGLLTTDGQTLAGSAARAGDQDRTYARSMMRNQTHLQDGSCGNCQQL